MKVTTIQTQAEVNGIPVLKDPLCELIFPVEGRRQ